ncbi:hypothetical protein GEO21_18850 [Sphingobacterium faecium]|uniref:hypothetical protein n=1 Tax=Sphingobacterium faecium TaxID=34087 RepID=UPI00136045E2|nr:hypothetical protein [Sphingobacterium faecium]MQP29552.1 hypothetical protein [Sphingobacterium faecium]
MLSGTLSRNGQEQVGTSFFAPYGAKFIRFTCLANAAPTPAFICRTRALGNWKSTTSIGITGVLKIIDVALGASNYNVSITFQTTDSNGGSCSWVAMK